MSLRTSCLCPLYYCPDSFFFNDTATTEIYTLSLHDALPICLDDVPSGAARRALAAARNIVDGRSEEHTSELQSRQYLVCRILLEKKKQNKRPPCGRPQGKSATPHQARHTS